ncbi:hypothetical protein [Amphibacillus jilinensis]|uniref:hypothetical protein n=1 Tax=Amphibacillus jilinensis TaxID=1216008 RepID=UPI0003133D99|nr:hypothetical protein [Amphibacillus jilinensis]
MIKDALKYLVELGNKRVVQVNGQEYATGSMHLIKEPLVNPLRVQSLSGLIDYLKQNYDMLDDVLIHVKDPETVEVLSRTNFNSERNKWLVAEAFVPTFRFDSYYEAEPFNIKLQSTFVQTDDRDLVLKVVGNIREENVRQIGDDGVSQSVSAKVGVATVADVKVPNPVLLAPYRTFTEVEQPESNFVLRMRDGGECALFAADGGAWQLEAMDNIKDHLTKELAELIEAGTVHIIA